MTDAALHPRQAAPVLREALTDSPVVLVHGPRQCGKSTLARVVGEPLGYAYLSFDDDTLRAAAAADPVGFVDGLPPRVILDEVQRVPALFTTLKHAVDRERVPGRFLLTGSANVLLLPKLADSLAGRMSVLRLHPLAQCELTARPGTFPQRLFAADFKPGRGARLGTHLTEAIVAGGYPAALARASARRRAAWYRDYLDALVQRDVRDLSRIHSLDALPRLLAVAAAQTAQLFNASDLAAPFQLSRPTIADYVTLLERVFLLERLPPWHSNRLSRLVKTPKLHLGDTGVACALLGVDPTALAADRELLGHLLETFVYQELRRQESWSDLSAAFFHYRDRDGVEVDIVIERGARALAGVEVKAAAGVAERDFRGLAKLRDIAGKRFAAGVVLYDGEATLGFGDRLFAVPLRTLWQPA
ncbi:MAG: ATP-binding protein [Rhodanobacter lindaniclasticus]